MRFEGTNGCHDHKLLFLRLWHFLYKTGTSQILTSHTLRRRIYCSSGLSRYECRDTSKRWESLHRLPNYKRSSEIIMLGRTTFLRRTYTEIPKNSTINPYSCLKIGYLQTQQFIIIFPIEAVVWSITSCFWTKLTGISLQISTRLGSDCSTSKGPTARASASRYRKKSQLSPLSLGNFQHWNFVSSHFPPMNGYHYPVIRSTPSFGMENHVETFGNHQEFSPPIGWEMWKGGEFRESPSGVLLNWCTLSCTGTVQVRFISPWMNHHEQQWVRAKLMTCDDELMDPKTKNQSSFCPTLCNAQTRLTSRPDQHSHRPWRSKWPYLNGYWVYLFRTLLEDSSHHNICPIWETLKQTGQNHV